MDISFHFFAVKTMAMVAGYEESIANSIANYSQFIDDFNWYRYCNVSSIPDYVTNDKTLDLVITNNIFMKIINPATTGFYDIVDLASLVLPRSQKFTVAPFHFIPQNATKVRQNDYRTYPAVWGDGSYISKMLEDAVNDLLNCKDRNEYKYIYMHLGMLLHTFADTYAHQKFTGYNTWENKVKLTKVQNNITGRDETEIYRSKIMEWLNTLGRIVPDFAAMSIGHMLIKHVPDLTHLTFSMEYRETQSGRNVVYTRSNTEVFTDLCRGMINILRRGLRKGEMTDSEWNRIRPSFVNAFLVDISSLNGEGEQCAVLKRHWGRVFGYEYSYSSELIKKTFEKSSANSLEKAETISVEIEGKEVDAVTFVPSDDFYRYNVYADKHLIKLYGNNPRSLT